MLCTCPRMLMSVPFDRFFRSRATMERIPSATEFRSIPRTPASTSKVGLGL